MAVWRYGGVFAHELRIAQDAVERRSQFMADGADVAAFCLIGLIGQAARLLRSQPGLLQRFIGLPVRLD